MTWAEKNVGYPQATIPGGAKSRAFERVQRDVGSIMDDITTIYLLLWHSAYLHESYFGILDSDRIRRTVHMGGYRAGGKHDYLPKYIWQWHRRIRSDQPTPTIQRTTTCSIRRLYSIIYLDYQLRSWPLYPPFSNDSVSMPMGCIFIYFRTTNERTNETAAVHGVETVSSSFVIRYIEFVGSKWNKEGVQYMG